MWAMTLLLAGASTERVVYCSQDGRGTTIGGWKLRLWNQTGAALPPQPVLVLPLHLANWDGYRQAWYAALPS